jgi:hypothetical protein
MNTMYALFERFELCMTRAQAESASHPGPCDDDVRFLVESIPNIRRQLDRIGADKLRAELREYGAWDETELADDEQNRHRIVWLAAGNISEELTQKRRA